MTNNEAIALLETATKANVLAVSEAYGRPTNIARQHLWVAAVGLDDGPINREAALATIAKYAGRLRAGIDVLEGYAGLPADDRTISGPGY
jgi:hypothetical protein